MSKASIESDMNDYGLPRYNKQHNTDNHTSVLNLTDIQNDLLNSESVIEMGKKYVAYQDILKQLFIQALNIKNLDKLRMAQLLNDIKWNPNNVTGWLDWLNQNSGDSITNL